jgi:elongation factor Ts
MANITPQQVKELREKTGAGMADCKKALVNAEGDMKKAIEILREKGAASAAKRSDRVANEGIVIAKTNNDSTKAVIVEINCETDFVGKNEEFIKYADIVADTLLNGEFENVESLMKAKVGDDTIEGLHNEILAKFSEKIEIRRIEQLVSDGYIESYNHAGNRLGVLVELNTNEIDDNGKTLIRDIAMQIAAMNPSFVNRDEVDTETLEKEKEIYHKQALEEGKKEEIAQRIAQGRLEKFFSENCLVEQQFVKDSKKTVKDVLAEISKDADIKKFFRFALGESSD